MLRTFVVPTGVVPTGVVLSGVVLSGVVLFGLGAMAAFSPSAAIAGAASPLATQMPAQSSVLTPVQFWDIGRCRAWRRECADRWGWRTRRWYRCLARHGCERHRYGDRWD